jgi:hypothetical protein
LIVSVAGLDGLAFPYKDVHRFDLFFPRNLVSSGGELDSLVLGNELHSMERKVVLVGFLLHVFEVCGQWARTDEEANNCEIFFLNVIQLNV